MKEQMASKEKNVLQIYCERFISNSDEFISCGKTHLLDYFLSVIDQDQKFVGLCLKNEEL